MTSNIRHETDEVFCNVLLRSDSGASSFYWVMAQYVSLSVRRAFVPRKLALNFGCADEAINVLKTTL